MFCGVALTVEIYLHLCRLVIREMYCVIALSCERYFSVYSSAHRDKVNNALNIQKPAIPDTTGQEGESGVEALQHITPSPGNLGHLVSHPTPHDEDKDTLSSTEPSLIKAPTVVSPVFDSTSASRGRSKDKEVQLGMFGVQLP